jgi:GntR family transcriptional repressor for pyruvate dehydrogenase complex
MTLSSQIVAQIRDALFAGELKTGDVLGSEADLVKQFGVSRMSVRDALRSLEAMGIVDIKTGAKGGAIIAAGSSERFADSLAIQLVLIGVTRDEVLQARAATESMTAALAATYATPADLDMLDKLLIDAEGSLDDPERSAALGEAFHLAVARVGRNQVMVAQLQAMRDVMRRPVKLPNPERARQVVEVHRKLFDLIAAGDVAEAQKGMEDHVRHWISLGLPKS